MNQEFENIRDQQIETWNKFSAGWKKWDTLTMEWLKPVGDEIIQALHLKPDALVLDIASGTGEPGLSIAAMLDGGKVVITDLAEDMLSVAKENAAARGIHNIETRACDVCQLPFADNSFDAVSCRFGFMFFPDMLLAAKEMLRVLKPGGRMASSVWAGPEHNFWVTATMGSINRNLNLPAPPPGAPGIFRCAADGMMSSLCTEAGFKHIEQSGVSMQLKCSSADEYWELMNEIAAPVVAGLSKADEPMRAKIKEEVYEALQQRYPDGNIRINSGALVLSAEK